MVAEGVRLGRCAADLERELVGVSHAEIGGYLLGLWGLPFSLSETAAYHHRPNAVEGGPTAALTAVHVADALLEGDESRLDLAYLDRVGLRSELPRWRAIAEQAG